MKRSKSASKAASSEASYAPVTVLPSAVAPVDMASAASSSWSSGAGEGRGGGGEAAEAAVSVGRFEPFGEGSIVRGWESYWMVRWRDVESSVVVNGA